MNDRKTNEIHRVPQKTNESQRSAVKYLVLLRQGLLLEMRELSDFFTFQQDIAPAHRLVLLLSCWKRKFPISFLRLCGRRGE